MAYEEKGVAVKDKYVPFLDRGSIKVVAREETDLALRLKKKAGIPGTQSGILTNRSGKTIIITNTIVV